jgi:hypothetical protein
MFVAVRQPPINWKMVEPASAAIAAYLLTEGPKLAHRIRSKRCLHWLRKHRDELQTAAWEETSGNVLDQINQLFHVNASMGHLVLGFLFCLVVLFLLI